MRSTPLLLVLMPLLAACDGAPGTARLREAPPAAAVIAPPDGATGLDEQLRQLAVELTAARDDDPERLLRAEALTDRLMEARRPVDWLGTGYDVEARLRQLQAMADRVVAMLRRGAALEEVNPEVDIMLAAVADLREQIRREGGGPAPPSLDSLLRQDPLRDVRSAAAQAQEAATGAGQPERETTDPATPQPAPAAPPPRRGPLGTPITPPDTGRVRI